MRAILSGVLYGCILSGITVCLATGSPLWLLLIPVGITTCVLVAIHHKKTLEDYNSQVRDEFKW